MSNLRPIWKTSCHRADVITSHSNTSVAIRLPGHIYVRPQTVFNHSGSLQRGYPWIYGQIINSTAPRSYNISTGNFVLRCNRAQLRPAAPPEHTSTQPLNLPLMQPSIPAPPESQPTQQPPAVMLQIEWPINPPPSQPQPQDSQTSETPAVHDHR